MTDYEIFKRQLRKEEERTGNYSTPWIYNKERNLDQRNCNCKFDPDKKGTCEICGGWVN